MTWTPQRLGSTPPLCSGTQSLISIIDNNVIIVIIRYTVSLIWHPTMTTGDNLLIMILDKSFRDYSEKWRLVFLFQILLHHLTNHMYSCKCQFNRLVWCLMLISNLRRAHLEIKTFLQNSSRKLCRIYALLNIRKLFNLNCLPGILPFIALSYMNLHIFLKIRESRQVNTLLNL